MKILLASRSVARKKLMTELCAELGVEFEVCSSEYEEDMNAYQASWRLAKFLALGKAREVAERHDGKYKNTIIVGSDTFITCCGEKIGKPKSIEDAKRIIRGMSGQIIKVYTGVAVVVTDTDGTIVRELVDYAVTDLWIKKMSSTEVDVLAHQKDALEISGAFSIEGEGGKMITRIRGDYSNVIGLPIFLVKKMLKSIGIKIGSLLRFHYGVRGAKGK